MYGFFFKAVVQSVLLFAADMWVVTPPHGTDPGGFPIPGVADPDGAGNIEEVAWNMGVLLFGGGERGGGVQTDGKLYSAKVVYGCVLYCDATNSGLVRGNG